MIFFNRNFGKRFALIALYYFIIVFIILFFDESGLWDGFTDRFLVYQFSIVFLIGSTYIDDYFNYNVIGRLNSRKQAIKNHMFYDLVYTVVVVSMLFVFLMLLTVIVKTINYIENLSTLIDYYFRYILTAFLLTNVSRLFSHSRMSIFRRLPQLYAFLVLLLDVLVLFPTARNVINLNGINFLFSWVICENMLLSYTALCIWNVVILFFLYIRCEREDLI